MDSSHCFSGSQSRPTEALPVLPLKNADPAHPTIWPACSQGVGNPYYGGGFFQFGSSFSRNAGLDAVGKFCEELIASQVVIGPAVTPTNPGSPKKTGIPLVVKSYDEGDGPGKIQLRVQSDMKNLNVNGATCPDSWLWIPSDDGYAKCRQYFGQSIDHCDVDPSRSTSDIKWENGGTVCTKCFYFSVQKVPAGGEADTKF